uniref:Uncharacterized protein n=1 Tax=Plectus sambesii TaxID=2011161 RepID=A0A914WTM9_9BILA
MSDANCHKLTKCAIKKCVLGNDFTRAINTLKQDDMFEAVIEEMDLSCIMGKCNKECKDCEQCNYAWDQILKLANGKDTEGKCPKLERCSVECIKQGLDKAFDCVRQRCNIHCFDGDCPSCSTMARRLFLQICRENDLPKKPNVNFDGSCALMFDTLSRNYVARKARNA